MENVFRNIEFIYSEGFYSELYMVVGCGFLDIVGWKVVCVFGGDWFVVCCFF